MVTCLDSLQKSKVTLQKLAVLEILEKSTLKKEVKKTNLDDDFWNVNEVAVNLLKPLSTAITQLEADIPNLAEMYKLHLNVDLTLGTTFSQFLPLQEQEKIATILAEKEEFCIKIMHKTAYFLDPRGHGMLLCHEEKVTAIEFICGLAETFSYCELLAVDLSSRLRSVFSKEWILCYAFFVEKHCRHFSSFLVERLLSNQELSKIASGLLKLPSTTAAVEQSFSCYSNIHTAKRNRLTNDLALKLVFAFQNIQRTAGQQSKHLSQAAQTSMTSNLEKSVHVPIAADAIEIESSSDNSLPSVF